jgi:hypothetical protein
MCVHKKRDKIGRTLLMIMVGLMAAGLFAARLQAQDFILSQNGKSVGKASLHMDKEGAGFAAKSEADIKMPGLDYKFSENESLDAGYHLTAAKLNGSVNGTSAKVETTKLGQQFQMKIDANGNVVNTPLAFHSRAVFFPDFDPGALQVLLNLGAAHNNLDIWALVPKQTGSVAALRIATDADMQGALNGRPFTVHHITATLGTSKTELFSSPANELLQAEWTDEGFAMVRQGFKLTPASRPGAPPAAPQQAPQQPAPAARPAQPPAQAPPQPQQ